MTELLLSALAVYNAGLGLVIFVQALLGLWLRRGNAILRWIQMAAGVYLMAAYGLTFFPAEPIVAARPIVSLLASLLVAGDLIGPGRSRGSGRDG